MESDLRSDLGSDLFRPLQIRDVRLKNRIVLSPMLTYAATDGWVR